MSPQSPATVWSSSCVTNAIPAVRAVLGRTRRTLRKLVLPSVSLLLIGGTVSAQERNPFAEWDRLQRQTETSLSEADNRPTPVVPRRTSRAIEYFAPGGATETLTPTQSSSTAPATAEAPVYRERMATTPAPPTSSTAAAAGSTPAAQPGSSWPASFPVYGRREAAPGPVEPTAPTTGDVSRAQYTPDAASPFEDIRRVSGASPAGGDGKDPSLDEFLRRYGSLNGPKLSDTDGPVPRLTLPSSTPKPSAAPATEPAAPAPAVLAEPAEPAGSGIAVDVTDSASGPQSPGVTLEWVPQGDLNVGQECSVDLVVHNSSNAAIRNVSVEAVIPANLQVLSSDPEPVAGTTSPGWTFPALQPGERRTITLTAVPRQRGDLRLDAFVRLTGYSSSAFAVQEPMIGIALQGPESGAVGEQLRYNIRVSNPGTGVARDVVVQAALPEGLEHRHGSLITMDVGTLNPGESQDVQLSLNAVRGGQQQLLVRAIAEGGLEDQNESLVAIAEPELDLLIDGPVELLAGRTAEYEVMVVNRGKVASANVRSRYRVPEGFEFVSADRGGKYEDADRSVEFFVGTLQPGESSSLRLTLKATQSGEQVHQAGVISEHGQVTMARRQTAVEGIAELKLNLSGNPTILKAGDTAAIEVQIANTGSRAAAGVGVSCELPPGLELIDANGPAEYIAENGVMVFRSVPEIAAGESITIVIRAKAKREGAQNVRLRVASSSLTEPLIGEFACRVSR